MGTATVKPVRNRRGAKASSRITFTLPREVADAIPEGTRFQVDYTDEGILLRPYVRPRWLRPDAGPEAAPPTVPCPRCEGCGQVADSEDQEPWASWQALPPGSDVAVRMGLVRPLPCPLCRGAGVVEAVPVETKAG